MNYLLNSKRTLTYCLIILFGSIVITSCSNNDEDMIPPKDKDVTVKDNNDDDTNNENVDHGESFNLETATDFFINYDSSVHIFVKGKYNEGTNPNIISRGIVYKEGTELPNPKNGDKTVSVSKETKDVNAKIYNLPKGKTFTIRGYLVDNKGNYTFSNPITTSTDVNASTTRKISFDFLNGQTTIVASNMIVTLIKLTNVEKEAPKEVGVEYSLKQDFSDIKSLATNENETKSSELFGITIGNLQTKTKYYVRPFVKYADGIIVRGDVKEIETK